MNIHDNVGVYDMHQTSTASGPLGKLFGIGSGEGSGTCAFIGLKVHVNLGFSFNGTNSQPAIIATTQGNGTLSNTDWEFSHNHFRGSGSYFSPRCFYQGGAGGTGSAIAFSVNNLTISANGTASPTHSNEG